ncbi:hypothetical protein [Isoptericola cucumis]|uniref:hypothetical protein n=1 Tax=Isoptericola cucumis TaxID=1776856 RepID=UPI001E3F41BD|nr:hypothetical protein [Isoptericola cucumis]
MTRMPAVAAVAFVITVALMSAVAFVATVALVTTVALVPGDLRVLVVLVLADVVGDVVAVLARHGASPLAR